jgi:putative transposase
MSIGLKRHMVEPSHPILSMVRQCALVSINRSSFYYQPRGETPLNLALMPVIDKVFLDCPFYGAYQMARRLGPAVSRKRDSRLMVKMGLSAIYQRPRTSDPHPDHPTYPYLLKDLEITRPNQSPPPRKRGSGVRTSLIFRCGRVFCISWRSWTGQPGKSCRAMADFG